jgi:hypothetical protein
MAGIKALIGDEVQDKSGKMCPVEDICAGKKAVGKIVSFDEFKSFWCYMYV